VVVFLYTVVIIRSFVNFPSIVSIEMYARLRRLRRPPLHKHERRPAKNVGRFGIGFGLDVPGDHYGPPSVGDDLAAAVEDVAQSGSRRTINRPGHRRPVHYRIEPLEVADRGRLAEPVEDLADVGSLGWTKSRCPPCPPLSPIVIPIRFISACFFILLMDFNRI
jgi:hypothetical protein